MRKVLQNVVVVFLANLAVLVLVPVFPGEVVVSEVFGGLASGTFLPSLRLRRGQTVKLVLPTSIEGITNLLVELRHLEVQRLHTGQLLLLLPDVIVRRDEVHARFHVVFEDLAELVRRFLLILHLLERVKLVLKHLFLALLLLNYL